MSEDVTLDEMAIKVIEWVDKWKLINPIDDEDEPYALEDHDSNIFYKIEELYTSLDVIREVEEALALEGMYQDYYRERRNGGIRKIISVDRDTAKQRLKAIYATLRESGEV